MAALLKDSSRLFALLFPLTSTSLLQAIKKPSELNTSPNSSIKLLLSLPMITALLPFLLKLRTLLLTLGTTAPLVVLLLSAESLPLADLSTSLST